MAGEVVYFHRADATPGVRHGVVLSEGAHGKRVMDSQDGTQHDVLHEGIYHHVTATADNLPEIVDALTAMGIPVSLTEGQKKMMKEG